MEPSSVQPLNIVLDAAVEASRDKDDWREGDWSNGDRNEPWFQSYVAVRLNDYARRKAKDDSSVLVTVEPKVGWLGPHCHATPKRGRPTLTPGQRFDIAVWAGHYVEGLVEIKNAPRLNDEVFGEDLTRLYKALRRWGPECNGSLRWGIFLFSAIKRRGGSRVIQDALDEELTRRLKSLKSLVGDDVSVLDGRRTVDDAPDCYLGWGAIQIKIDN